MLGIRPAEIGRFLQPIQGEFRFPGERGRTRAEVEIVSLRRFALESLGKEGGGFLVVFPLIEAGRGAEQSAVALRLRLGAGTREECDDDHHEK